jgi:CRISPR-associated endoribonuclease Cas6
MRVRVDVTTADPVVAWGDVHGPARAVVYRLIGRHDPVLARELHDSGWQGSTLGPAGISPPMFVGAAREHAAYTTSANGSFWIGSPVPEIASALVKGIASERELSWGKLRLAARGVELESPPDHRSGQAEFATMSPVLVKHESRFLLPRDDGYASRLAHNICHEADLLGLPGDADIEVIECGPRRGFDVAGARRIGATSGSGSVPHRHCWTRCMSGALGWRRFRDSGGCGEPGERQHCRGRAAAADSPSAATLRGTRHRGADRVRRARWCDRR